jgi:hypothetical protein
MSAMTLLPLLLIAATEAPEPIFRFETDELWLNLHHYLYVLGRAEARLPDATREAVAGAPADEQKGLASLGEKERAAWREAVAFYAAGPSRKDLIFDEGLAKLTRALADADDSASLADAGIDAAIAAQLERAAPLYRKAWWPAHRTSNRERHAEIGALVDRHGRAVLDFITGKYGLAWPAGGYPVHFSAFSNWAGAYSATVGESNVLVLSSRAADGAGSLGLETVFHEGMHQWDSQVFELLREHARRLEKRVPANLTHGLIWVTAAEAVRRVIPGHKPLAEVAGIWQRGMAVFKVALDETWKPYLDGRGARDEALRALIAKTAIQPRQ